MNIDPPSRNSISDKLIDHGHRAHYLGKGNDLFPLPAAELVQLAQNLQLTSENESYLAEMIEAVRSTKKLPFVWTPQEQFFLDHSTNDQVIPYLLYRFKFHVLPERRTVTDFPVHLLVEPISVCNLRCVMCFQTDSSFTKKPFMGLMDFGLYKDVIDQAVEGGAGALSLGSRGEPFLHPNLGKMLRYASDKKAFFDLKINTNATKLTEAQCHDVLSSDVNLIALSIDAHEKALYEDIRVRGNFDEVVQNVRRLREIRDKSYPNSKVEIRVSGVRFREDQNEAGFREFWSKICDTVVYVRAQLRWNTYENDLHPERDRPCDFLWNKLYVWHDGTCNPCDEDYKSYLSPGSVKEHSIRDIWHGEQLSQMRQAHINGDRANYNPCDRCGV
jgi:radical SAM protein with 4Fe4S-binding SPASM domain